MKILIVEGNRKRSRYLSRVFAEEGYLPDVCSTGAEAILQIETMAYDLLVLGRLLPGGKDGISVCQDLRAEG
jgi:two-component system OmpR family response regulator